MSEAAPALASGASSPVVSAAQAASTATAGAPSLAATEVASGSSAITPQRMREVSAGLELPDGREPRLVAFAPGRTELAGNHVDHQGGMTLSATIDRGISAVAAVTGGDEVRVFSVGHRPAVVNLREMLDGGTKGLAPRSAEFGSSVALVRGMVAGVLEAGGEVTGFDVATRSNVPSGGGLSSSAAFEVLLGQLMNVMFLDGRLQPLEIAKLGQRAESQYFDKPCGLQDQSAVAFGGIANLDFSQMGEVSATRIDFDFAAAGYDVVLVDVGSGHSDNTELFAAIPRDMDNVARFLGCDHLEEVDEGLLARRLPEVRAAVGDLALMRALHYKREVASVKQRIAALQQGDMVSFCQLTTLSGQSSAQYLQNVSAGMGGRVVQPAMVALSYADYLLDRLAAQAAGVDGLVADFRFRGACRIHGGGFGGTIQVYVPCAQTTRFVKAMDAFLKEGACTVLNITKQGAWAAWL